MFENFRQRRVERLMETLDDTPVTPSTVKQRNKLVESLGRNGVAMNGEEYTTLEGQPLRPIVRKGTRREQTRDAFHRERGY